MEAIRRVLARGGGVATLAQLARAGHSEYSRASAIRRGEIVRVRNGWFASPDAPPQVVRAVRVGGRLSCISALAHHGLWTMPDDLLHVSVPANSSRLRTPDDRQKSLDPRAVPSIAIHWRRYPSGAPSTSSVDSIGEAVAHLISCRDLDTAIVTIDSALNKQLLSSARLGEILKWMPAKYAHIANLVDPKSQSGLETLARLRLRRRGIRVRTQVEVSGVGHVDTLIGDRLILELDSRAHHLGKNYELDRARDLVAIDHGYLPLRVTYQRVLHQWQSVEEVVLRIVRRGEHEWRGMHRRLELSTAGIQDLQNSGKRRGANKTQARTPTFS
jgi:very-short-patch-repair endonuclease